ncbi:MAG: DNA repair protein RecN [Micropruina sp.]|nr:DNA repair protein RecN [Micropruina sp.]
MLTDLRIRNLGVIGDAEVEPHPGFTVVTGETGAGKTMIVTGLSLLLGGRADPRLIRNGAEQALIEGRWRTSDVARVADLGGVLDEGEAIVSRQLGASRSRTFVGGVGVPTAIAAELVAGWVTIHGQAEQQRLAGAERQRTVLDTFAGESLADELSAYRVAYAERRRGEAELTELTTMARERERELAMLTFGLDEVAKTAPQPQEDQSLAAEATRLQAVDDLRLAGRVSLEALSGDDDAVLDQPSAIGLLGAARKALATAAHNDPSLSPLAERLTEAGYLVNDVAADLASYLARLDADPTRLEWIAARRSALQNLTRKYGDSVDEVLGWAGTAALRVAELGSSDHRIHDLTVLIATLGAELAQRAERITAARVEAAARLAALVDDELNALAMPHARLRFRVSPTPELGPHGADQIALLFAANPGGELGPLGKVASGGELSRVRLALEVVLADVDAGQTFVFDEVDAGVGGSVALEIGRRLAQLARRSQVIVVTHLAQVAAFADRHFVVEKADDGQVTTSGIRQVQQADRLSELARMMGGLESTSSARAHAAELLVEAGR